MRIINMEYRLVKTMSWKGLAKKVNKLIQEGWVPQGGPLEEKNGDCVQAMVKQS